MYQKAFPVIDPVATGANIVRLRIQRGLSVRDLQAYFGFEEPQAIYKWQKEKACPPWTTCTPWERCWRSPWMRSWFQQGRNCI